MGQTRYPSKSWNFKSRFSFNVRLHGKQQLCLQYKVCWVLYKLIVLLHFHSPDYAYNHLYNLHQKSVSLLESIFISLFFPYLFTKSSLQSSLTFPSSIPQQFCISSFLRATIPTIYTKNNFLPQQFSQFRIHQGAMELGNSVRTDTGLISPFFLKVWTVITGLTSVYFRTLLIPLQELTFA